MTDTAIENELSFQDGLKALLDQYSHDDHRGTNDHVMATYLQECIASLVKARNALSGDGPIPSAEKRTVPPFSEFDRDKGMWTCAMNRTVGQAACRDCGAEIRWQKCETTGGVKNLPFNTEVTDIDGRDYVQIHFETCAANAEEPEEEEPGDDLPF